LLSGGRDPLSSFVIVIAGSCCLVLFIFVVALLSLQGLACISIGKHAKYIVIDQSESPITISSAYIQWIYKPIPTVFAIHPLFVSTWLPDSHIYLYKEGGGRGVMLLTSTLSVVHGCCVSFVCCCLPCCHQ
jgi:hypothetical protein